jgi:hypothetical protein
MKTPVIVLPQRKTVQLELFEVAPDIKIAAKPTQITAPRVGIMRWTPNPDGSFRPEIETHPATVNIREWKEAIYGCSKLAILALVEAEFVDGERISPRTMNISLESYFNHRAKMRDNPWFWQDHDNRARYTKAMDKIKGENRHKPRNREGGPHASEKRRPTSAVIPLKKSRDTSPHPLRGSETPKTDKSTELFAPSISA